MSMQRTNHLGYVRYAITSASKNVPISRAVLRWDDRVEETGSIRRRMEIGEKQACQSVLPEVGGDDLRRAGNCVSHFGLHDYLHILPTPFLRRVP